VLTYPDRRIEAVGRPLTGTHAPGGPGIRPRAVDAWALLAVIPYMDTDMTGDPDASDELLRRAEAGHPQALVELFDRHRGRLRRMVRLRMDRRLQGRVDPSDVLQDAQLEVLRRAAGYAADPRLPPFLWLRLITGQRLIALHRRHLGARMRGAGQEIALHRGPMPQATSASLAEMLLGRLTSPTQAAQKAEVRVLLQEALNGMDPIDREVLTLRHFEELSNAEVAQLLGLSKTAASNRYIRALDRLREILAGIPGLLAP
jgi:RNA polymerase sigma-70 factor, ECF subfamily